MFQNWIVFLVVSLNKSTKITDFHLKQVNFMEYKLQLNQDLK